MFAKLLKHEWRATAGTQAALCAAIISMGILAMASLSALIRRADELNELATVSLTLSLMFIFLAIVICAAASSILLMVRFYQSRFTDQGYLTFTLPVNVHQNFLSSFVNTLIWTFLVGLSTCAAFSLVGLAVYNAIGLEELSVLWEEISYFYGDAFEEIGDALFSIIPVYGLQLLVSQIYSIVVAMTCLTVGATLAKKHKILAAIGVYYLVSMATSMLQNTLTVTLSEQYTDLIDPYYSSYSQILEESSRQILLASLPLQIVMIAGCYILSTQMMKKKLNLN